MGLDMHLNKRTYVIGFGDKSKTTVTVEGRHANHIKSNRIQFVSEEVGYWRKANAIHNWFVEMVQQGEDDCKEYLVEPDQLMELQSVCEQVLENPSLAQELLPTQSGFFFGGTEYDDYYMSQLRHTIEVIEGVLGELEMEGAYFELYYNSSW